MGVGFRADLGFVGALEFTGRDHFHGLGHFSRIFKRSDFFIEFFNADHVF